ncbi:RNA-binding protein [Cryptosporidium felis]|nr:RNA-binding protein [Cryptosporidium felis]
MGRAHSSEKIIALRGLDVRLTEGDIAIVFSQWGELVDVNLVRERKSGISKGFCFLCYEDQRSTILAVDNANDMVLLGRRLKVDHVKDYKPNCENYEFSGAEGKGIGVFGVTKDIQTLFKKELDILNQRSSEKRVGSVPKRSSGSLSRSPSP